MIRPHARHITSSALVLVALSLPVVFAHAADAHPVAAATTAPELSLLAAPFSPAQLLAAARPSSTSAPSNSLGVINAEVEPADRRIRLYNTHTGERLNVVFRRGTDYVPEGLRQLELHLRDHRTRDARAFDPALFDLLADLAATTGQTNSEIHVISGYRSPRTNAMLRERSTAVAKKSLHMEAQAIDIRLPGVPTAQLRDAALKLGRGGVGYYQRSDFIHVDTGRVRRW